MIKIDFEIKFHISAAYTKASETIGAHTAHSTHTHKHTKRLGFHIFSSEKSTFDIDKNVKCCSVFCVSNNNNNNSLRCGAIAT